MHSKGDTGAQLRHSASRVIKSWARSFLFSPFLVGVRTFPIVVPPFQRCVVTGEGVRDWVCVKTPLRFSIARHDTRHISV